jgi:hypothetical protein
MAARIASAAIVASADIGAERSRLYLDLIHLSLSGGAKQPLEDTMNSLGYEYQSDFARRYFGEGKAEGRIEGRMEDRVEQPPRGLRGLPGSCISAHKAQFC